MGNIYILYTVNVLCYINNHRKQENYSHATSSIFVFIPVVLWRFITN